MPPVPQRALLVDARFSRFLLGFGGLALILGFAALGPASPAAFAILGIPLLGVLLLLLKLKLEWTIPVSALLLLTPQFRPGLYVFDAAVIFLSMAAIWRTVSSPHREAWDIRGPGWIALLFLLAPVAALPMHVTSYWSYLGSYKVLLAFVLVFHSVRRLLNPQNCDWLLWTFPIVGTAAAIQLLVKTQGIGGRLFMQLDFRTFYTFLGWGRSNYIAALLALCLLGTLLLGVIDRRNWVRLALAGASLLMLQAFVLLFSRAATVSLAIGILIVVVGLSGRRAFLAALGSGVLGLLFLSTRGGQVILERFADPREYLSWYDRFRLWEGAWSRFLANPWTGIGLNQGRYQLDKMAGADAHNFALTMLMEQGLLGAVALGAWGYGMLKIWRRFRPRNPQLDARTVRVAVLAAVVAPLVNASAEPTITGYVVGILYVLLLSWLVLQDSPRPGSVSALRK